MSLSANFAKRALAVGAASALALGGLLVASPAAAEADEPLLDGPAIAAVAHQLAGANVAIQGAALNADGNLVVIAVGNTEDERQAVRATVEADGHGNPDDILFLSTPAEAAAATDVVGGAGYLGWEEASGKGGLCSVGFSAWSPSGKDAVVTAGHCQSDSFDRLALTVPTGDTAGGGDPDGADVEPYAALGAFGFHQYGGPGNTTGEENAVDSIDIAVIDVTNGALNLKPEVTDWTNTKDLSASTTRITSVGKATAGQNASKSGRTTGVTSGTVEFVDGSLLVSDRWVHGFAVMGAQTIPGDSGGAVYSGETALGVTSATAKTNDGIELTWASDLANALPYTKGYAVKLFIEAPVVTTANGAEVERGASVTGTGPAGSTIVVTAGGKSFEAAVDGSGAWSFPAPSALGAYPFTVHAKKGFDTSEKTSSSINVVEAALLAPVITSPANGAQLTSDVTTLTGTGLPGATVTVAGDATGTAKVADDGTFSVTLSAPLSFGTHSLTVTQASDGKTSPEATTAFSVVLVAPVITSPAPDSSFPLADAPTKISGTGIDGATVTVSVDGAVIGDVKVVDGVWTYVLPAALTEGKHTITATQSIDGVTSAVATSIVTVTAPAGNPGKPDNNDGDGLAKTGVEPLGFLGGAAALLLAGGLALAIRRGYAVIK